MTLSIKDSFSASMNDAGQLVVTMDEIGITRDAAIAIDESFQSWVEEEVFPLIPGDDEQMILDDVLEDATYTKVDQWNDEDPSEDNLLWQNTVRDNPKMLVDAICATAEKWYNLPDDVQVYALPREFFWDCWNAEMEASLIEDQLVAVVVASLKKFTAILEPIKNI